MSVEGSIDSRWFSALVSFRLALRESAFRARRAAKRAFLSSARVAASSTGAGGSVSSFESGKGCADSVVASLCGAASTKCRFEGSPSAAALGEVLRFSVDGMLCGVW